MFNRRRAAEFSAGDIGLCFWKGGLCGPGNLELKRLIEALGVEWRAEPDVFYCATHTELVVERALSAMQAHRGFVSLETLTDD
jgi:hypothetical protein